MSVCVYVHAYMHGVCVYLCREESARMKTLPEDHMAEGLEGGVILGSWLVKSFNILYILIFHVCSCYIGLLQCLPSIVPRQKAQLTGLSAVQKICTKNQ